MKFIIAILLLTNAVVAQVDGSFSDHNTKVMQESFRTFRNTKNYDSISSLLNNLKKSNDGLYTYSVTDIYRNKVLIQVSDEQLSTFFKSYPAFEAEFKKQCEFKNLAEKINCFKMQERGTVRAESQHYNPKVEYSHRGATFTSSLTGFDPSFGGENLLAEIYIASLKDHISSLNKQSLSSQSAKLKSQTESVRVERQKRDEELALLEKQSNNDLQAAIERSKKKQLEDRAKAEASLKSGVNEAYKICKYKNAQTAIEQKLKDEEALARELGYGDKTVVDRLKQANIETSREILNNKRIYQQNTGKEFDYHECQKFSP